MNEAGAGLCSTLSTKDSACFLRAKEALNKNRIKCELTHTHTHTLLLMKTFYEHTKRTEIFNTSNQRSSCGICLTLGPPGNFLKGASARGILQDDLINAEFKVILSFHTAL